MSEKPPIDSIIEKLKEELIDENCEGIILTGSYARGDATTYSDLDITKFVKKIPKNQREIYNLRYINDCLVSIFITTIEEREKELSSPGKAIWIVEALRQAKIISDPNDKVKTLLQKSKNFSWDFLEDKIPIYVGYELSGYVEEVHKIINGILKKDESTVINAIVGLIYGISNIIAVDHKILIKTENEFFSTLYEHFGNSSKWVEYHRIALGLQRYIEDSSIYLQRGRAALLLYLETIKQIKSNLLPEHMKFINNAKLKIKKILELS